MIFGKIDYINLLPFHIFLKKASLPNAFKQTISYKKGVPSKLNKDLYFRRVDAAVISSVESKKRAYKTLDLGIVAKKEVKSVLVKEGISKPDKASASSNMLCKILGFKGEVIIGDRALKEFLKNPDIYIDLAKKWNEKYGLPFVFARLCVNKNIKFYKRLAKNFLKTKQKIPNYILKKYSKEREIPVKEIISYLKLISYDLNYKEKKALKLFLTKAHSFNKESNK